MQSKSKSIARLITKFEPQEIRTLFRTAKPVVIQSDLEVRRAKKQDTELARLLIVTPRAVGTAVERNLLRRQIKHIFYEEKLFASPYDLLVLAKKGATQYSFEQLKFFLMLTISDLDKNQ